MTRLRRGAPRAPLALLVVSIVVAVIGAGATRLVAAPIGEGAPVAAPLDATTAQREPRVASSPFGGGAIAVVWIEGDAVRALGRGPVATGVPITLFDSATGPPAGLDLSIDDQAYAAVVFDVPSADGGRDVVLAAFDPYVNVPVGTPRVLGAGADGANGGDDRGPAVTSNGDDHLVTWVDGAGDGSAAVLVQPVSLRTGAVVLGQAPSAMGAAADPDRLAIDAVGDRVALALDVATASGRHVQVAAGARSEFVGRGSTGAPPVFTTVDLDPSGDSVDPDVGTTATGDLAVAWTDPAGDIRTRRRTGGAWSAEAIVANEPGAGVRVGADVLLTDGADHVVLWEDRSSGAARSRRFRATDVGQPFGPEQAVDGGGDGVEASPAAAVISDATYRVVYLVGGSVHERDFRFNDPPTATDDSATTTEDVPVQVDVLAGDADPDGDTFTVTAVEQPPSHGTATIDQSQQVTYTPDPDWSGVDGFTYRIEDGAGAAATGSVQVTVAAQPDPPAVVAPAPYATSEAQRLDVPAPGLLAGATDPDPGEQDQLAVSIVRPPRHGVLGPTCAIGLVCNPGPVPADGSFGYVPDEGFCGAADDFVFRVTDPTGSAAEATAVIDVSCGPRPPVAVDDTFLVAQDGQGLVFAPGVLANDGGDPGRTLQVVGNGDPERGVVEVSPDGSFSYRPPPGFVGIDRFTYDVGDGVAQSATPGTVVLVVGVGRDEPLASPDAYLATTRAPLTITADRGLLVNDTDPRQLPLQASLLQPPAHGTVTVSPDGAFTYTPDPVLEVVGLAAAQPFQGIDGFTYEVSNGTATSAATVKLLVGRSGAGIVATGEQFAVLEGRSLVVPAPGLLANDVAGDGRVLALEFVDGPVLAGRLERRPDGSFVYAAPVGFRGVETLRYRVVAADGSGEQTASAIIVVVPAGLDDDLAGLGPIVTGPATEAPEASIAVLNPPSVDVPSPPAPVVVRAGVVPETGDEAALPTPQVAVAGRPTGEDRLLPWRRGVPLAVVLAILYLAIRVKHGRRALEAPRLTRFER